MFDSTLVTSLSGSLSGSLSRPLSGGGRFSPADLSGLTHLYDARDDSSIAVAAPFDWTGTPGGVAIGAGAFEYVDLRDSLLFEGRAADFLAMPSIITGPPFTVIAAVTPQPITLDGPVWSANRLDAGQANRWHTFGIVGGNWEIQSRAGPTIGTGGTAVAAAGFQVVSAEWSSTSARRIRVDAGAWESDATAVTPAGIDRNDIGKLRERTNDLTEWDGEIHRIAFFDRVLTDAEHDSMYAWMQLTMTHDFWRDSNGYVNRDSNGNPEIVKI